MCSPLLGGWVRHPSLVPQHVLNEAGILHNTETRTTTKAGDDSLRGEYRRPHSPLLNRNHTRFRGQRLVYLLWHT
jgi:hypothetical protein